MIYRAQGKQVVRPRERLRDFSAAPTTSLSTRTELLATCVRNEGSAGLVADRADLGGARDAGRREARRGHGHGLPPRMWRPIPPTPPGFSNAASGASHRPTSGQKAAPRSTSPSPSRFGRRLARARLLASVGGRAQTPGDHPLDGRWRAGCSAGANPRTGIECPRGDGTPSHSGISDGYQRTGATPPKSGTSKRTTRYGGRSSASDAVGRSSEAEFQL